MAAKVPKADGAASLDHISSIRVARFKSLAEVEVELGAVNVFVGANGSGKSNLLEAIGVLGAAAAGRVDDQALLRRGVRPGVPRLYRSSFKGESHRGSIKVGARTKSGAEYEATISNQADPPKPWWIFSHEHVGHGKKTYASRSPHGPRLDGSPVRLENHSSVAALARASLRAPRMVSDLLATLDDYAIFAPVTPVLRGIAPDSAPRNPVGLFGGQLPEALSTLLAEPRKRLSAIRQALEFVEWAEDFTVGEPSRAFISPSVPTMRQIVLFVDRFMAEERNTLSGYDASEGALYILFALVLALHAQAPRCLALDNFDQALNPRAARDLARVFTKHVLDRGRQVLLTTHNPLVLDGLALDDDRVRLFAVERDGQGHTHIRRVPVRDLEQLKAKYGEDAVSRLWINGRLGGMPNVAVAPI